MRVQRYALVFGMAMLAVAHEPAAAPSFDCAKPPPGASLSDVTTKHARDWLAPEYQRRLGILAAIKRPSLVDCDQPGTSVDEIVCPRADLREAYVALQQRTSALMVGQQDGARRSQLRRGDDDWRR